MSHARQQIRDALVSAVTGLTTTGARVYNSYPYPLDTRTQLPALSVFAVSDEREDSESLIGDSAFGTIGFRIDAFVADDSNAQNTMDLICAEVETAIMADQSLGSKAHYSRLLRTEFEYDSSTDQPLAVARMEWAVAYMITVTDPTTLIGV